MSEDPKTGSAPHDCPNCGEPAYVGGPGFPAQCTSRSCPFWSEDCWVRHVIELPDEEVGVEFEIEDEPTQPRGLAAWLPSPKDLTYQHKVTGGGKLNLPSWDDLHSNSKHPPRKKDEKVLDND